MKDPRWFTTPPGIVVTLAAEPITLPDLDGEEVAYVPPGLDYVPPGDRGQSGVVAHATSSDGRATFIRIRVDTYPLPGKAVSEEVGKQEAKWMKDHEASRVPREVRGEIRDRVKSYLRKGMLPVPVFSDMVVIDQQAEHDRIVVLREDTKGTPVRTALYTWRDRLFGQTSMILHPPPTEVDPQVQILRMVDVMKIPLPSSAPWPTASAQITGITIKTESGAKVAVTEPRGGGELADQVEPIRQSHWAQVKGTITLVSPVDADICTIPYDFKTEIIGAVRWDSNMFPLPRDETGAVCEEAVDWDLARLEAWLRDWLHLRLVLEKTEPKLEET